MIAAWLLLFALLFAAPASAVVDPVGWWKFDEGSGSNAADSGSGTTDCTLVNTPTWAAGHIGSGALSFARASNEYATCTTDAAIDLTGNITISAWVNPSTLATSDGTYYTVVSKGYNSGADKEQYVFRFTQQAGSPMIQCGTYAAGNNHLAQYTYGGAITTGNWYHVVCRFNGATWKIYVGAVETASLSDSTAPQATDQPLVIGGASIDSSVSREWDGLIDDVRLYDRDLSTTEISDMFNQAEAGVSRRSISPIFFQ